MWFGNFTANPFGLLTSIDNFNEIIIMVWIRVHIDSRVRSFITNIK